MKYGVGISLKLMHGMVKRTNGYVCESFLAVYRQVCHTSRKSGKYVPYSKYMPRIASIRHRHRRHSAAESVFDYFKHIVVLACCCKYIGVLKFKNRNVCDVISMARDVN